MALTLHNPTIGAPERKWVLRCLDSGFVSSVGPLVAEFERAFARQVGARFAVAVSSGTAALHVTLHALGIGREKRVVVPDLTFVASANPVLYCGAEPVFADVDPKTWMLDPDLLRALCLKFARDGRPISAVIPVHLYGGACDMSGLLRVAREFNLLVVEDATEALGANFRGRQVGTFGQAGCFSFNGNKLITTGGGGMVVTDSQPLARRIRHLVNQARPDPAEYVHDEMGFNYRMTNLTAALGLGQLERLPMLLKAKARIGQAYDKAFAHMPNFAPQGFSRHAQPAHWLYSIVLPDALERARWMKSLAAQDIPTRRIFHPLHSQPYLRKPVWTWNHGKIAPAKRGVSDDLYDRGLNLPSSPDMTAADQRRITRALAALAGGA